MLRYGLLTGRPGTLVPLMRLTYVSLRAGLGVLLITAVACGSTVRELDRQIDTQASPAEVSGGVASPSGNCDVLARVVPKPVSPLETSHLSNGTMKLTSAEGGYSIAVPGSWVVAAGSWTSAVFGQAHLTSYDPQAVDYRMQTTHGMVAPEAGIRLDIEVWTNPTRAALDDYAKRVHIGPAQIAVLPGTFIDLAGRRAYQAVIQEEHRYKPEAAPLIVTRQTRILWLVPTVRQDRVLVVHATPGESHLRSVAETAVSTLEIFAGSTAQMPVVRQRDETLRRWLYDEAGNAIAGRRAEAKLVTYAESRAAMQGGSGLLRIDRDPEELFWLVAVTGPGLPLPRGGPRGPGSTGATPTPTAWMLYQTPATNDRSEGTGGQSSSNGTWPPGFDGLTDRCR